jgi:hypothetical protein
VAPLHGVVLQAVDVEQFGEALGFGALATACGGQRYAQVRRRCRFKRSTYAVFGR